MAAEKDKSFAGVVKHSLAYAAGILLAILPVISARLFMLAVMYALSHFAIDLIKFLLLKNKIVKKTTRLFVADQCAHYVCIFVTAYLMYVSDCGLSQFALVSSIQQAFGFSKERAARWILAMMIIHKPANIFIQTVLSELGTNIFIQTVLSELGSKQLADPEDIKAGRKIGSIERLIMLLFIAMDQYTAMGVVLTAKSIARYDQISKEQKFAEYYLIGTLLSTACVVLCKVILL